VIPKHSDLKEVASRRGSFLHTLRAVGWSFFGVRKRSEYEKDVHQLNPVHVIVAGLLAAAVFVGVLVLVVQWIASGGPGR
jgi:hypothetical protein